ncbi:MAG: response regulator [Candidatus Omnitrophota bacterium]|jgi:two-component system response regulator (stage 0 sporulation protein F)
MVHKTRKKVLVVDDEEEIADFLCSFLRRFGVDAAKAKNAQEVFKKHKEDNPDYIFLDIEMPECDGIEILRQLKKNNSEAKVIMITGKTDNDSLKSAKKYGAIDYITKPLDLLELSRKIENYIL